MELESGIYLCLFDQGTLKVGRASNVKTRLSAHRAAGSVFGISVIRTDFVHVESVMQKRAETMLIQWCAKNCTASRSREWFEGVNYDDCLSAAKDISEACMGPNFPSKIKTQISTLLDRIKSPLTREQAAYEKGRADLISRDVPPQVINALDILHKRCEIVRASMSMGGSMPDWYDELNVFGPWEDELFMSDGNPDGEFFRAAADALEASQ